MLYGKALPAATPVSQGQRVFAALDLGTNNCRLLVARASVSGFEVKPMLAARP